MKVSVVTPSYNCGQYLETAVRSVLAQRRAGTEVEYIVVDGGSTDRSPEILEKYRDQINGLICEPDKGPADAINKGLARASGDVLAWLNADDFYFPGALERVVGSLEGHRERALCFGRCPIVDGEGEEIRRGITWFKELFYPLSSRFAVQSVNFVSQPATFFRRSAWEKAGPLRLDLVAAWDYDFLLRLWRRGGAARVAGPPLAAFRWHEASISGSRFRLQFKEDWEVAAADAGRCSPQSIVHYGFRWGIVTAYSLMAFGRALRGR